MARKRMLDPSIWTDEGMAELTPRQQLLYIGLLSNADDEGRLKATPAAIRLTLPTLYDGASLTEVQLDLGRVLGAMSQLITYTVDGRPYLAFLNYRRWQKIDHPSASDLPPPSVDSTNGQGGLSESSLTPRASRARAEVSLVESSLVEEKLEEESIDKGSAEGCAADAASSAPDPVDWVWAFYKSEIQPEARLCPHEKIRARLKRFAVDELTVGIQNFRDDAWCMAHNRTRGGAWFFHSDARSEHFLTMEPDAGAADPAKNGVRFG